MMWGYGMLCRIIRRGAFWVCEFVVTMFRYVQSVVAVSLWVFVSGDKGQRW